MLQYLDGFLPGSPVTDLERPKSSVEYFFLHLKDLVAKSQVDNAGDRFVRLEKNSDAAKLATERG